MIFLISIFIILSISLILYEVIYWSFYKDKLSNRLVQRKIKKVPKKSIIKNLNILANLEKRLSEASINIDTNTFVKYYLMINLVVAILVLLITSSILLVITISLTLIILTNLYIKAMIKRRLKLLQAQLSDTTNFISNSLKSGYTLMQSFNMIAKNSSPPVSQEFQRVIDEVNMGKSYEEAFAKMIERCPLEDLEVLINAILLSKESGGNLSHVLDTVSETIRDRERLSREVKSLTSQGRLSGYILALLPIGLFLLIFIISPDYVTPFLENPMGKILLFGVLCSQIIGFYFIKKIVQVEW